MDLRAAASRGDERAVKTLLDGGIVDTENWHLTRSPLSLAAGNGYTGVVRLLVEKGKFDPGEVDEKDRTALSWAAGRGHKGVVKFLLAREDKNVDCIDEDGWTPLSWASGNGFLVVVKLLLEKEADVNSKDRAGRTPLSWAAAEGHKNIVKILLAQANIDVENDIDKKERTPFLLAAAKGKTTHRDIMGRILAKSRGCLNKADENGRTALSWAAGNGRVKAVKMLLKEKVDIHAPDKQGRTPLSWAAESGHHKVVKLLLDMDRNPRHCQSGSAAGASASPGAGSIVESQDIDNQTPILYAARSGHEKVVKLLLEPRPTTANAEDKAGRTPLSWAAGEGHITVVEVLLPVNGIDIDKADNDGQTPLAWAAIEGQRSVTWKLLKSHPNQAGQRRGTDDRTPLMLAAENGHHTVVKELLNLPHRTIKIDASDHDGRTALMLAYNGGHNRTVKLLIEQEAGLNLRDPDGLTILMLAARDGNDALVELLIAHNADLDVKNNNFNNFTALNYASGRRHDAIVRQLRAANQTRKATAAKGSVPPSNTPTVATTGAQGSGVQNPVPQSLTTTGAPTLSTPPIVPQTSTPPLAGPAQAQRAPPTSLAPLVQTRVPQNASVAAQATPVRSSSASQNTTAAGTNAANLALPASSSQNPAMHDLVAQIMAPRTGAPTDQTRPVRMLTV